MKKIPEEPQLSQNVITFAFRMQDGSKLIRRFDRSDRIEVLFNYIETRE